MSGENTVQVEVPLAPPPPPPPPLIQPPTLTVENEETISLKPRVLPEKQTAQSGSDRSMPFDGRLRGGRRPYAAAPAPHAERPPEPPNSESMLTHYEWKDVDKIMNEGYIYPEQNSSTICDIVGMYLKGQKILYTEAKTVCEVRLHYLMLPAILITSAAAILSMILKEDPNGSTIVSVLNAVNTFLLTLINYLKLDARAEAHRTAAYKFDKLQSYMEFNSGRMLFDVNASRRIIEILQKVENDVREIKETNQFILPEKIRYEYPLLYSTNVFAEVKKITNMEMLHVEKIKTYMNRILELERPFIAKGMEVDQETSSQIAQLEAWRQAEVAEVLKMKPKYLAIDERFEEELKKHRDSPKRLCDLCRWLKL